MQRPRVLVIGAGLSGLACARTLAEARFDVVVIDKARGPGGRASTRRTAAGNFDHGAQYLTARDAAFAETVAAWEEAGVAAPWTGRLGRLLRGRIEILDDGNARIVGVPRMSALLRHVAGDLTLRFALRATTLGSDADGWRVRCEEGEDLGPFAEVVVATPSPQAVPLLAASPELAARAADASVDPCWAVMLAFDAAIPMALDGAFVEDSPLSWIARDGSKPGRDAGERFVLHGSPRWSAAHVDLAPDAVVDTLLAAFAEASGHALPIPHHHEAHRWLYARTRTPLGVPFLRDDARHLSACGDYCLGARLEDAWRSGHALGAHLVDSIR